MKVVHRYVRPAGDVRHVHPLQPGAVDLVAGDEVEQHIEDFVHENLRMLDAALVAPMVLRAILQDHRLVFDHSDQRQVWIDSYQRPVLEAFAVIEEEERNNPSLGAVHGPGS